MKVVNIKYILYLNLHFVTYINCADIRAETDLIKDFSKHNSLTNINLLACWSEPKTVAVIRTLNDYGIKVGECKDWAIEKCFHGIDFNVGFVVYDHCDGFEDIVSEASRTYKFSGNQFWLIISSDSMNTSFWENANLGVDADVTFVNTNNLHNNSVVLQDIYNTGYENGGVLVTKDIGTWSIGQGIQKYSIDYKTTLRSDLKGLLVNSSVIIVNKFKKQTYMSYVRSPGYLDVITKSQMFALQYLSELFNFRMYYRRITRWGQLNTKNGSFDGEVGLMQRKLVDVGGNNLYLRMQRLTYAHYLGISSYQSSIILFKQPGTLDQTMSGFLKPLHMYVWWFSSLVAVLTMLSFLLTMLLENYVIIRQKMETNVFTSSLLLFIAIFCQQSGEQTSKITSVRLIIITSTLFSFLILQFYSASIVSSLLSEPPRLIKNTHDLLKSNLQVRIHDIPYHKASFETTQVQIARELYAKKCSNGTDKNIFVSIEEGIELVFRGGYAFYGDTNDFYGYIGEHNKSKFCELDEFYIIPKDYLYLCTRKQYHMANMLGVGLRRLTERGITSKEASKWIVKKPRCFNRDRTDPVGIPQTKEAFYMLLWGFLIALIILMIEMMHWRYNTNLPFVT